MGSPKRIFYSCTEEQRGRRNAAAGIRPRRFWYDVWLPTPIDQESQLHDQSISPEEQALAADELAPLRLLLTRLTPGLQEPVELRLAGLTSIEIARLLGKSHDAVRKAQLRTLAALKTAALQTPGFQPEAQS